MSTWKSGWTWIEPSHSLRVLANVGVEGKQYIFYERKKVIRGRQRASYAEVTMAKGVARIEPKVFFANEVFSVTVSV